MNDTQSEFPEMPDLAPGQRSDASQSSQVTHPVASASEETHSGLVRADGQPAVSVWRPLAVLVLLPVGLVAAVMLAAWLLRLAL